MKRLLVIGLVMVGSSMFAQEQLDVYLYQRLSIYEPKYDTKAVATVYAIYGVLITQAMHSNPDSYISKSTKKLIDNMTSKEEITSILDKAQGIIGDDNLDIRIILSVFAASINSTIKEMEAAYQTYYLLRSELWR